MGCGTVESYVGTQLSRRLADVPVDDVELRRRRAIGERVRRARRLAEVEQRDLAERLGIHARQLRFIEAGRRPPDPYLPRIAAITGKPLSWFYTGEEPSGGEDEVAVLTRRVDEMVTELQELRQLVRRHGLQEDGDGASDQS